LKWKEEELKNIQEKYNDREKWLHRTLATKDFCLTTLVFAIITLICLVAITANVSNGYEETTNEYIS